MMLLMMVVGVTGAWGENKYYALHQNGAGYLRVNGVNVNLTNDGTFRYGNIFDDNGSSLWVITTEGYLKNNYFYLNVANNSTLYLSVDPVTQWTLEDIDGQTKKHVKINDGSSDLYLCYDNKTIKLATSPSGYYNACPISLTEKSWSGPTTSDLTLQSPQLITYLRGFFTQKFDYTFVNDAGATVKESGKERRVYATYSYVSGGSNKGKDWDITSEGIIYNKKTEDNVAVTATYNVLPADPITLTLHPTASSMNNRKFTIQQKAFTPTADMDYLFFSIKGGDDYRYPYDDGISENSPVKANGNGGTNNTSVLSDPLDDGSGRNQQISWKITTDDAGFCMFKNTSSGRYLYFNEPKSNSGSIGDLCVGATTLPTDATLNKYKFRLYKTSITDYGTCYYIIPYSKQFAIYKSDGIATSLYASLNITNSKTDNTIRLFNSNDDSKWCIYKYEAEYRVRKDFTFSGPASTDATGNITFKSSDGWYGKYIKESPTEGNGQEGLVVSGSYNTDKVNYIWTVIGLDDYIDKTNLTSQDGGYGKTIENNKNFTFNVSSLPVSTASGTVQLQLRGGVNDANSATNPYTWSGKKTLGFTILGNGTVVFTDISSLSAITSSGGAYRLTDDVSYTAPGVATFSGILDCNNKTISGLTAPLFTTLTNGTVCNLNISGVNISQDGQVGAIACVANGGSRIYNVGILDGNVGSTSTSTANSSVGCCGGLVGLLDGSARVINCFSYANITGGNRVGGIVGYNNFASTASDIRTMVMNCMFYGDIEKGNEISPIYGGNIIDNAKTDSNNGLNNYNYYRYESNYSKKGQITNNKYNCALAAEEKYLIHFELYRLLLNSNRKLAAFYATGSADNANQMAKWVLESANKTINNPKPYPVLKSHGTYPSIINYDDANVSTLTLVDGKPSEADRNKGGKFGSLSVTISDNTNGKGSRTGSFITTGSKSLPITDKDFDKYNYNYYKVRLPYYNEVGKDNYKDGKVVTGWVITDMAGATQASSGDDITYNADGTVKDIPYNFADRTCTKDENGDYRVFSQGAYFDVPIGVSTITIKPYWANAAFISDKNLDKTYTSGFENGANVTGAQYTDSDTPQTIHGISMKVRNSFTKALGDITKGSTVYDNAIVLVGNVHQSAVPYNTDKSFPFTVMSADFDNDNEPDFSLIYHHTDRVAVSPIRFDFINIPSTSMAQKPNGSSKMCGVGIFKPYGWFEVTNTTLISFGQIEYDFNEKSSAPLILLGGEVLQIVSNNSNANGADCTTHTKYIHVGSNVWFKEFNNGTHSDKNHGTPHRPISVTGGRYEKFYLSGIYQPTINYLKTDAAECYISGGSFGEVAGAGQEKIDGDVNWIIDYADIDNFYGGGINAANAITGDINVTIKNSHVDVYCGGPKFGNMGGVSTPNDANDDKIVTTNAEGCVFRRFFGAGYGGASYNRVIEKTAENNQPWGTWDDEYTNRIGKFLSEKKGIATGFEYEYFIGSKGTIWGRFYVNYASFSKAITNNVNSTLKNCHITGDYYGGGSLGVVSGTAYSTLDGCTVDGSVFGGGYSGSIPTIDVVSSGFSTNPGYNSKAGLFTPAVISDSVSYKWDHVTTLSNNTVYINPSPPSTASTNNTISTDQVLTNLGQVNNVDLTIKGSSYVKGDIHKYDEEGKIITAQIVTGTGGVFGGGDSSSVNGNAIVKIEGTSTTGTNIGVMNVYGGGNTAEVGGNVSVTLKGNSVVRGNVFGGGNEGIVEGSTEVNILENAPTTNNNNSGD